MVGQRIKTLRKEKNMTQTDLAEGIVTKSMLSMIENGKAEASMRSLREIAKRLGVSLQSLLSDPEEGALQRLVEEIDFQQLSIRPLTSERIRELLMPHMDVSQDTVWYGRALVLLGDSYFQSNQQQRVLTYYEQAIEQFERLHEKEETLRARLGQIFYLMSWNRYEEATRQLDQLERQELTNVSAKTHVEYSMLIAIKYLFYEDDVPLAITQLESTIDYMERSITFYRADDVYRLIAICGLYIGDEPKIQAALEKAKQYVTFTNDEAMRIRLALTEAFYAIDYRRIPELKVQIDLIDELLDGEVGNSPAYDMMKGIYHAMLNETETGRAHFLRMMDHYETWKLHHAMDRAIYFEGLLIGTQYGCGNDWIPQIEQELASFPPGRFYRHLTSLLTKAKQV